MEDELNRKLFKLFKFSMKVQNIYFEQIMIDYKEYKVYVTLDDSPSPIFVNNSKT